jgi:hypothetical protein
MPTEDEMATIIRVPRLSQGSLIAAFTAFFFLACYLLERKIEFDA